MRIYINKLVVFAVTCLLAFTACKDAWKDREDITVAPLNKTILEELSDNENTTEFYKLITKTGVDKILGESRSFTVWAPNNTAIQQLDNATLNDAEKLKAFVLNHISYQSHFCKDAGEGLYIKVLNTKNIRFESDKFEGYPLIQSDVYLKNGVLHVVNGSVLPKPNALEYLASLNNKQYNVINSLYYQGLDVSKGVILYYDPITFLPVYQEGTTSPITKNYYLDNVANLASEDSLYTYFILSDAAFDYEMNALKDYNKVVRYELDQDSLRVPFNDEIKQDSVTKWEVIKDLAVKGVYNPTQFTDSLTTVTGVKIKVNPSDIVSTKSLSNGIAYVINKVNYKLFDNKIPTVKIEGVATDTVRTPAIPIIKTIKDFEGNIVKQKETTSITSSPSPLYYFRYQSKAHSTKYAIYWRARNTVLTVPFKMGVVVKNNTSGLSQTVPETYYEVPVFNPLDPETFKETFVGYVDITYSGRIFIYVMSSTGATSALPTALALNYIKLVPVN